MPILQQPAQPPVAQAGADGTVDLEAMAKQIEGKIPPQLQQEFQALVLSGDKVMFDPSTHKLMLMALKGIGTPAQISPIVSQAIVKLMKIILKQSGVQKAMPSMPSAALVLMCHALRFVQMQMHMPVTAQIVNQTTRLVTQGTLAIYKISPQQVQQAMAAGQQAGQKGQAPPAATKAAPPQAPPPKGVPMPSQEGTV